MTLTRIGHFSILRERLVAGIIGIALLFVNLGFALTRTIDPSVGILLTLGVLSVFMAINAALYQKEIKEKRKKEEEKS
jgi:uncharacterized membrane protein